MGVLDSCADDLAAPARLTLTAGNYEIVLPSKPNAVEKFAAQELREFLGRALVEVKSGSGTPTKVMIYLGRAAGIDVSGFAQDEFVIRTRGNDILIAGRDGTVDPSRAVTGLFDRATMHGVYTFLEEQVGCRFYFPGELGEVVPRLERLELGELDIRRRPDFLQRNWYTKDGAWYDPSVDANTAEHLKMLHWFRTRGGTVKVPCCHGTNGMKFRERFEKTHPEYFALRSDGTRHTNYTGAKSSLHGHLCYSSGIRDVIVDECEKLAKKGKKYFDIMPNDGMPRCRCEKCRAMYNDRYPATYASELIWDYTAYVARKLIERGVPGYVTQMAYAQYRRIPENVDLPTNVLVMVAETGPWSYANPVKTKQEYDEIRAWKRASGNPIWIWTYPHKHGSMNVLGFCDFAPHAWGRYYRDLAGDIFGTFAESETDRWIYHHLNYYVFQRVLWDAKTDVEAVIAEYYRLMFGRAEKPMAEFFTVLEEKWTKELVGNIVDADVGPVCQPPLELDIWSKVYGPDTIARLERCLAAAEASVDGLAARRVAFVREQFLSPLEAGAAKNAEKRAGIAALRWNAAGSEPLTLVPYKVKKEPSEYVKTAVTMNRDAEKLTVVFDCEDNRMDELADSERMPDDPDTWRDNGIEFFINPNADRHAYYHFVVNSRGALTDRRGVKTGMKSAQVEEWDSGAKTEVVRRADGWKLILTIPIKSFREPLASEFPAEFVRNRYTKSGKGQCLYHWSPFCFGFNDVPEYGTVILEQTGEDLSKRWSLPSSLSRFRCDYPLG